MADPTATGRASRAARAWRRALAVVLGVVTACAAVECIARVGTRAVSGRGWDGAGAERRVRDLRARLSNADWSALPQGGPALHPYVGVQDAGLHEHLARAARETRASDPSETFELGIVGGSVSVMLAQDGGARLAEVLERDPRLAGRRVRVHALGHFGHKQPQQIGIVAWALALGFRLDALVNVDGFNEVAVANQNAVDGAHPLYPFYAVWAHVASGTVTDRAEEHRYRMRRERERIERACDRALAWGTLRSAALGPRVLASIERGVTRHGELQVQYVAELQRTARDSSVLVGPEHPRELGAVLETAVGAWVRCSLSLAGLCERHGIAYLHVLQPTLHDVGSKPATPEELADGAAAESWVQGAAAGYPLLRAASAQLVDARVPFLDASRLFADTTERVYSDACHLVPRGSQCLAEAIAEKLLAGLPER